jgi:hypothetical protein
VVESEASLSEAGYALRSTAPSKRGAGKAQAGSGSPRAKEGGGGDRQQQSSNGRRHRDGVRGQTDRRWGSDQSGEIGTPPFGMWLLSPCGSLRRQTIAAEPGHCPACVLSWSQAPSQVTGKGRSHWHVGDGRGCQQTYKHAVMLRSKRSEGVPKAFPYTARGRVRGNLSAGEGAPRQRFRLELNEATDQLRSVRVGQQLLAVSLRASRREAPGQRARVS